MYVLYFFNMLDKRISLSNYLSIDNFFAYDSFSTPDVASSRYWFLL